MKKKSIPKGWRELKEGDLIPAVYMVWVYGRGPWEYLENPKLHEGEKFDPTDHYPMIVPAKSKKPAPILFSQEDFEEHIGENIATRRDKRRQKKSVAQRLRRK